MVGRLFLKAPAVFALLFCCNAVEAQQLFELRIPGSDIRSSARLDQRQLVVNNNGEESTYQRDPQFDVEGYIGFSNQTIGKVVRWPTTNRGSFQIGELNNPVGRFRQSRMLIVALRNDQGLEATIPLDLKSGLAEREELGPETSLQPRFLKFSSDGRVLIIAADVFGAATKGAILYWDMIEQRWLRVATGFNSAVVSDDGTIAHITQQSEAVLQPNRDVGPRTLDTNVNEFGGVEQIMFSGNGGSLVAASRSFVHLFDVSQTEQKTMFRIDGAQAMAIHPSGATVVLGRPYGRRGRMEPGDGIRLVDANGQEVSRLIGHEFVAQVLVFSADGNMLASADSGDRRIGRTSTVYLWTGNEKMSLKGQDDYVFDLAFSAVGNLFSAAGRDGEQQEKGVVRVWDLSLGHRNARLLNTIDGHNSAVIATAFSPDGTTLASGDVGGSVLLSNLKSVEAAPLPQNQRVLVAVHDEQPPHHPVVEAEFSIVRLISQDDGSTVVKEVAGTAAKTIAKGVYEFTVPAGNYGVTVSGEGYEARSIRVVVRDRAVEEDILLQRITIPAYPVVLSVRDEQDGLVNDATVTIPGITVRPKTSNDGSYRFELQPGVYEVTINKKGYEPTTRKLRISDEAFQADFQLRMAPPPTYSLLLTLQDEKQKPVDIATIEIAGIDFNPSSDVKGLFEYRLKRGTYDVTVSKKGFQTVTSTIKVTDKTVRQTIQLVPIVVPTGTLELALIITDLDQQLLTGLKVIADPDIIVEAQEEGAPYLFRLRPAIYEFAVSVDGLHFAPGRLEIEASDTALSIAPLAEEDHQERELKSLQSRMDVNRDRYLDARDFPSGGWDDVAYLDENGDDEIQWEELRPILKTEQPQSADRRRTPSTDDGAPRTEPIVPRRSVELRTRLDRNRDGAVDSADFPEAGWQGIIEILGRDAAKPLSDEDLKTLFPRPSPAGQRKKRQRVRVGLPESKLLDQLHARLDYDRSGSVDQADFPGSGWEAASSLDVDEDKELSRDELRPLLPSDDNDRPDDQTPSEPDPNTPRGTLIIRIRNAEDIPQ